MVQMKKMNVRFEEKSRIIPPAPRVAVPDTGGIAGRGQSQSSNSGEVDVRMGIEKKEAGSWNYAFGPPPPGVDPEFDRRVASELAKVRGAKEGGGGGDRLVKAARDMTIDERQQDLEWSIKNVDSQLGDVKNLVETSNNIPEEANFEHDVAVALKEIEANSLTLQQHHRHEQQRSEPVSDASVNISPLMHLDARHSAEGRHQLGSDILSEPNTAPPQSQVYGRAHHVNDGLPDLSMGVGNSTNPVTYSRLRHSEGLASMWQGEEGSALQRRETREKQLKYRHELQQQIQARQDYQKHQQHQHWPLEYQHAAATSIPYIGDGIDRNAKTSYGHSSRDGENNIYLTNVYSQQSSSPLGAHAHPGRSSPKTGLVSPGSQLHLSKTGVALNDSSLSGQQRLMGGSGTQHPHTTITTISNRSISPPYHSSPLVGVSCSNVSAGESCRLTKEEYAAELRKQIAEKNEQKALQLRKEEEAMVAAEEMQREKHGDAARKASTSRQSFGGETSGISAPFDGTDSRNRVRKGMEVEVPRQVVNLSSGVTMSSSAYPPLSSSIPSAACVVENGPHLASSSGLSAHQRLMEDVYGSAAGLSIQLWGAHGRESGTKEAEKARKKYIALEQRLALGEQIEMKQRLREEDEARKRQEEEAEQRRMMQEQIAYENEQKAIRDKQLADEQQRLEQLYEQQRQALLKRMPIHRTAEVACDDSTRDPLALRPPIMHHQSQSSSKNNTGTEENKEHSVIIPHHTSSYSSSTFVVPEAEGISDSQSDVIPSSFGVAAQKEAQETRCNNDYIVNKKKNAKATKKNVNSHSLSGNAELPHGFNYPSSSSLCFEESSGLIITSSQPALHNDNNTLQHQQQEGIRRQQYPQQLGYLDLSPRSEDTVEQSLPGLSRFVAIDSPSYLDGQQDGDDLSGDSLLMFLSAQQLEQENAEELERISKEDVTGSSPPATATTTAMKNQLKEKKTDSQIRTNNKSRDDSGAPY